MKLFLNKVSKAAGIFGHKVQNLKLGTVFSCFLYIEAREMDFLFWVLNRGQLVDSKSGLIHFWASNLLAALFIPCGEKGEGKWTKK